MRVMIWIALCLLSLCTVTVRADDDLYVMPPTMDATCDACAINPSLCYNSVNVSYSFCGVGSLQSAFSTQQGNQCCLNLNHESQGDAYACMEQHGNFTATDGNWYVVDGHACADVSSGKGFWLFQLALWIIICFFIAVIGVPLCIICCCCYWCCRRRSVQSGYVVQQDGNAYYAW